MNLDRFSEYYFPVQRKMTPLLILVLITSLNFPVTVAAAAYTGCPDTWPAPTLNWKLDRTSGLPDDLIPIDPFFVTVTVGEMEHSADGLTWYKTGGFVDNNARNESNLIPIFGGGFRAENILVKVRGCEKVVTRKYLTKISSVDPKLYPTNIKEYYLANLDKFPTASTEKAQYLEKAVADCLTSLKERASTINTSSSYKRYSLASPPSGYVACTGDLLALMPNVYLLVRDPSCFDFSKQGWYMNWNKTCELHIGFTLKWAPPKFFDDGLPTAPYVYTYGTFGSITVTSPEDPVDVARRQTDAATEARARAEALAKLKRDYEITMKSLNDIKRSVMEIFAGNKAFFLTNTSLASSLQRAIDFQAVASPTQADLTNLQNLLNGNSEKTGLLGDLGLALDEIKKFQASQPKVSTTQPGILKTFSIKCKKGKLVREVKGSNPKCPTGYKKL